MSKTKDLGIATAYGYAVSKGYTGTEEEFAELMKSYTVVAEEALEHALDAEAWAVGTKGGEDVPVEDERYHNNSKYYAGEAKSSADKAENLIGKAGYIHIGIDADGHLQYIKNNEVDVTFNIDSDGHLVIGGLE